MGLIQNIKNWLKKALTRDCKNNELSGAAYEPAEKPQRLEPDITPKQLSPEQQETGRR
jgi:hypothetical protein